MRNRSKGTVRRLVVTDTPPKDAGAHSASATTTSAGNLVWRRASLAPGQRWTLNVRMDVPAGARGEIVNRVRVASANAVAVQSQAPTRGAQHGDPGHRLSCFGGGWVFFFFFFLIFVFGYEV